MLAALLLLGAIVFILAPWIVPLITPGFPERTDRAETELTRIMVLSPVFLALGAMATSVLNAHARFAAAAIAPIVYNLAIIAGTLRPGARLRRRPAWRSPSSLGSLGHLLVQLPVGLSPRLPIRAADRRSRSAGAPGVRAHGPAGDRARRRPRSRSSS